VTDFFSEPRLNHNTPRGVAYSMGKLDGPTAIISGAARGQGRAHALALSEEDATIVACDVAEQIVGVPYARATKTDLDDTARLVTEQGGMHNRTGRRGHRLHRRRRDGPASVPTTLGGSVTA